jgi:hypothetical protein
MPLLHRRFGDIDTLLVRHGVQRRNGVKPIFTWPVQKGSPRGPILDKKKGGVKFKENIIISSGTMYRSKITGGLRNMQNIFKKYATMRGRNCRVTNMLYCHTDPFARMDLIIATIILPHDELVEVVSDVVGSSTVGVPHRVKIVGC